MSALIHMKRNMKGGGLKSPDQLGLVQRNSLRPPAPQTTRHTQARYTEITE